MADEEVPAAWAAARSLVRSTTTRARTDTRTFVAASAHVASSLRKVPLVVSAFGSLPRSHGLRGAVKDTYDLGSSARCCAARRCCSPRPSTRRCSTKSSAPAPTRSGCCRYRCRRSTRPDPGAFPASARIRPDERLLLFLGRINRLKGVDLLIEAVEPLLGVGTTLVLVGRDDGQLAELRPLRAALRRRSCALRRAALRRRAIRGVRRRRCVLSHAAALGGDIGRVARGGGLRHGGRSDRASRHARDRGRGRRVRGAARATAIRDAIAAVLETRRDGRAAREHVLAQHGRDTVSSSSSATCSRSAGADRLDEAVCEIDQGHSRASSIGASSAMRTA